MAEALETPPAKKNNWVRTSVSALAFLALACGCVMGVSAVVTKIPGEERLENGERRNSSVYVKMADGTPIAVDVWLPPQSQVGQRMPVIMDTTRYWRAQQVGWLARALYGLGFGRLDLAMNSETAFFNQRGFVILQVDARGTGASGGDRLGEWAPAEVKDLGEVAHWASLQPWSNGSVGAMGVSYSGNTAEIIASTGEPALKAVAPLYDDFDPQLHNSNPGGVFNTGFITAWGQATGAMDRNDICALAETPGVMCILTKWMVRGVKPVDADVDGHELADIVKKRKSNNVLNALSGVEYRGDAFKDGAGLTFSDISPYSMKEPMERHQVPTLIWSGWQDAATTDGTLSRFLTFNTPQEIHIGALSHGGDHDADPFSKPDAISNPNKDAQLTSIADFFDKHLRGGPPAQRTRIINYYTMGAGVWRQTDVWPPRGLQTQSLYFGDTSSLLAAPQANAAPKNYRVDFAANMGTATRWHTQNGGGDVIYPDRKAEDLKLLTFTSAPTAANMEITGTPIVTIFLSTTASDGVVMAYLEDVAPDGRVTYITEGILRFNNRKETSQGLPYVGLGVDRSFKRADALPVTPGEVMQLRVPLYATSVQIKAGHRIRVALAGGAQGLFDRTPKVGAPVWTVYFDASRSSHVALPSKN